MWSSCSFSPESGINTLILRSLMKLDDKNQFWMHDHVRDLGRAIVREEDVRNPYKCSRIWSNEVALDLLRNKKGNDRVEVLMLDMYQKDGVFTDQNFKKLSGLRYLEVTLGRLTGDFSKILPNMRWLRMYGCRSIPTNFNMRKLVVLDLGHCDLKDSKKGWEGLREAHQLKVIDMESCTQLKRAPNLSQCRSLESINFNYCFGMKGALHIGNNLQNLKTLKFRETEITKLTGDIETLQCLEEIVASREVTDKFVELLPRLPTSLKRLSISIRWGGIPNLAELEDLEYLSLINCHQLLLRVDNNMWKLPNLKELKLFHCSWYPMLRMGTLPSSLTHLSVLLCGSFLSLPCLANLNNLAHLALTEFEEPEIRGLGELRALESVEINDAPNLTGLDGLENLLHLEELVVRNCGALERIPNLANLIKLRKLITINCRKLKLEEVTGLEGLVSLEELELSGSSSIRKLPSALSELRKLKSLNVGLCPNLTDATVAGKLESLGELQLWQCSSIRELPNLSGLKRNLNRLKISECTELTGVTGIGSLENLKVLCVSGLRMVREFEDLSGLENLVELDVSGCTELTRVAGIERMERLEKLYMGDCRSLTELVELSGLKKLVILNIGGCTELTAVRGVEKLSSLTHLRLSGCKSINGLGNLSGLKNLENLDIRGCTQITQVKGLEELEKLEWLESDLKFLPKYYWLRYGKRLVNRLLS
ncbi:unnamed protein product [Linum trigynum]|uniref:Disease resistance protein Roq1-like winged-helix domain-containing protein n=1 Tax=Linum trigynum TaxID=586398 RepID=A0AAV2DHG2_9ROSI